MIITIHIDPIELNDGTFKPRFEIIEWMGEKANITSYDVDLILKTKEEAMDLTKRYATKQAREIYGDNADIRIDDGKNNKR